MATTIAPSPRSYLAGFETMKLPREVTAIAPDGSEVRVLLRVGRGSMAHFRLQPGQVSRAVTSDTVEEIWYVVAGTGEMWRRWNTREETVKLGPGDCISLPRGTHFQFLATGDAPFDAIGTTMPAWDDAGEAHEVRGPWEPKVPSASEARVDVTARRLATRLLVRRLADHRHKVTPFCGKLSEILQEPVHPMSVAMVFDIRPTVAHFHRTLEETYFILDGSIRLALHEPLTGEFLESELGPNELCVIPPGVHHRVVQASEHNRLCVLCMPAFDPADEHASNAWPST